MMAWKTIFVFHAIIFLLLYTVLWILHIIWRRACKTHNFNMESVLFSQTYPLLFGNLFAVFLRSHLKRFLKNSWKIIRVVIAYLNCNFGNWFIGIEQQLLGTFKLWLGDEILWRYAYKLLEFSCEMSRRHIAEFSTFCNIHFKNFILLYSAYNTAYKRLIFAVDTRIAYFWRLTVMTDKPQNRY